MSAWTCGVCTADGSGIPTLEVLHVRGSQQAHLVLLCAELLCNDFPHIFSDLLDVLQHSTRHQGQWPLISRYKQLRGRPSNETDLSCPDDHTAPLRDPDDLAGAHGCACAAGLLQPGDFGLGFVLRPACFAQDADTDLVSPQITGHALRDLQADAQKISY